MSVVGIDPKRDKWAKRIIYGGGNAYFALIGFLASMTGSSKGINPGVLMKLKHSAFKNNKSYQNRAWENYSQTGNIKKAIKILFWDP